MAISLAKRAFAQALYSYFALRTCVPVWRFLNRQSRAQYRRDGATLYEAQARVARELLENGIAVTHLQELFPHDAALFEKLAAYTAELAANAKTRTAKAFLKNLWQARPLIEPANPFVQFALADPILRIVNAYMDMYARFFYMTLNVTTPVGERAEALQSQRWHRDPEDKRMCKVFVYLTDVDETAGPFTYVRGSHLGGRYGRVFPQRWPKGSYPPPGAVERMIPRQALLVGTGRAGTIIFADTAGLHKGGYATAKERVMFTGGYVSPGTLRVAQYRRPENFFEAFAVFPTLARYALTPLPKRFSSLLFYRFKKRLSAQY